MTNVPHDERLRDERPRDERPVTNVLVTKVLAPIFMYNIQIIDVLFGNKVGDVTCGV